MNTARGLIARNPSAKSNGILAGMRGPKPLWLQPVRLPFMYL